MMQHTVEVLEYVVIKRVKVPAVPGVHSSQVILLVHFACSLLTRKFIVIH